MNIFNITELYIFKMFTVANQMLHEFYHNKTIKTYKQTKNLCL